jgi:hypothetical protein
MPGGSRSHGDPGTVINLGIILQQYCCKTPPVKPGRHSPLSFPHRRLLARWPKVDSGSGARKFLKRGEGLLGSSAAVGVVQWMSALSESSLTSARRVKGRGASKAEVSRGAGAMAVLNPRQRLAM